MEAAAGPSRARIERNGHAAEAGRDGRAMIGFLLSRFTANLWPLAGIAAAALLLTIGVQTGRLHHAQTVIVEVQNAWALDRAQATAAALSQTEAYRAEETRRAAAHQEIVDEADRKTVAARADAVIADAAAGKLRERVAALVREARAATSNPAAPPGSTPAPDAAGLLADLQRRADERAGDLARIADERGVAGSACEAAYSALTAPTISLGRMSLGDR